MPDKISPPTSNLLNTYTSHVILPKNPSHSIPENIRYNEEDQEFQNYPIRKYLDESIKYNSENEPSYKNTPSPPKSRPTENLVTDLSTSSSFTFDDKNQTIPVPIIGNEISIHLCIKEESPVQTKQEIALSRMLLKELPLITSKDFIGKELCATCYKEVKESQQSISCNTCDRWTHRKCCQIKIKRFKRLAKMKSFDWFCRNCRKDDEIENIQPSEIKYEVKDVPDDYQIVMKTQNDLLIIHLNCRSIIHKLEELEHLIETLKPDIICLSETWLDHSVPENSHIPEGYSIIRKDRSENFQQKYKKNKGGGVAILYRTYLNVEKKTTLTDDTEDILWAQVKMKNSFLLGVIYRPQYSQILDEQEKESKLEQNIRKASEISSRILVTGDFNADMRNQNDNATTAVKSCYKTYNLKQLITKATRIDPATGKGTLIDHIWSSPEIETISSGTFIGLSDHLGTFVKLPKSFINYKPPKIIKYRNFKNYNSENFAQDFKLNISKSKLDQMIENEELDKATEELVNIIYQTASIHAPIKYRKKKNKCKLPWSNANLKNKITNKNKLLQDMYTTKNPSIKKKVSLEQKVIRNLKRSLKTAYYKKELDEAGTDPTKLWEIYNSLIGKHQPSEEIEPENLSQTKANEYNEYFAEIGKKLVNQSNLTEKDLNLPPTNHTQKFSFKPETTESTEKLIDYLKIKTATGMDEINVRLVKDLKKEIAPLLCKLINLGYSKKAFPHCMKKAIIRPIYKRDNKNNISNYRPIAILPAISKIFERSAQIQFTKFFETTKRIIENQHAYRPQHSTITCLVETIDEVHQALDNKKHAALITLDLSKAFDCLNHNLLLQKLNHLGLDDSSLAWTKSYLENRTQVTKFQHFTSNPTTSHTGVPQGSILGPLFFICFTNDLPTNFTKIGKVNAYADDTQILVTTKTTSELKQKIELAISTAQNWFQTNKMKINADKTKVLIFNSSPEVKNITINITDENGSYEISSEEHIEVLGIFIDKDLNWKKQIKKIKRFAMGKIRNLHRINHMLSRKHRINLYLAVVSPQFDYGDILWGGCSQKESLSLQRIQNFAMKSILGKRKRYSTRKCMQELKFLSLEQRRQVHYTVFLHKALLGKSSANLQKQISSYVPKIKTRNAANRKLIIPAHSTARFRKSPLYKMISAWNESPPHLPKDNIQLHKKHYQKYLVQQTYPDSHPS